MNGSGCSAGHALFVKPYGAARRAADEQLRQLVKREGAAYCGVFHDKLHREVRRRV